MQSEALKLEKMRLKALEKQRQYELTRELVNNPVVEVLGAVVLGELVMRTFEMNFLDRVAISGMLTGAIMFHQLSPTIPYLAQGATDLFGSLTKAVPLLAAARG